MNVISAELWELISFFEIEPVIPPGEAWPYTDAVFVVACNGLSLSCAIAPAYKDVRLIVEAGATRIYELNAMDIDDLRYRRNDGEEFLDICLAKSQVLTLRVKPTIQLSQAFKPNV